jgi:hypothetical protein
MKKQWGQLKKLSLKVSVPGLQHIDMPCSTDTTAACTCMHARECCCAQLLVLCLDANAVARLDATAPALSSPPHAGPWWPQC